jgi:diaminohydroxyphosphoribosylaminopyrimidine deaminase/5-amino-6-(5-phosphoribosylamino)uracil reductase
VAAFVAPIVLGGRGAPSPVAGRGAARLALALRLAPVEYLHLGRDLLIQGRVRAGRP